MTVEKVLKFSVYGLLTDRAQDKDLYVLITIIWRHKTSSPKQTEIKLADGKIWTAKVEVLKDSDTESFYLGYEDLLKAGLEEPGRPVSSPELVHRALKKIRPDSPDVTRAAKRVELAKKNLRKIHEVEEKCIESEKSYLCEVHKSRKSNETLKNSPKGSPINGKCIKEGRVEGEGGEGGEEGGRPRENELEPGNRRESLGAICKTQKRYVH
ncbi:uncharacterized protein LOC111705647 [Eurytemora carolleeae]|uniref:uncharacterized protein LOC111705647 n=1 Tax=Eurytemora carolleeae TaxID=1294199 RepID=UPI000C75A3D1|nr:uncharacterized protein LOC111705647 [Eurytemora carolleeae]|eukprot:XP_023334032.1 uncharacterized protein LOC111705647 [Eurytemora affinis]